MKIVFTGTRGPSLVPIENKYNNNRREKEGKRKTKREIENGREGEKKNYRDKEKTQNP